MSKMIDLLKKAEVFNDPYVLPGCVVSGECIRELLTKGNAVTWIEDGGRVVDAAEAGLYLGDNEFYAHLLDGMHNAGCFRWLFTNGEPVKMADRMVYVYLVKKGGLK